jgi:uroporphyrinogen-III decarboxylase
MGDSLAGPDVTSPRMFDRFARPYEARLVKDLAADGHFVVIHICGDTSKILDLLAEYGTCGFDLDYKTDAVKAKQTAGKSHVLCGNLDPSSVIAQGTVEQVREAARQLISIWKPGGRFILNSGCAIPPTTPPENIHALVSAAHEFGEY